MKKIFQLVAVLSLFVATAFVGSQVNAQSTGLGVNPRKDLTVYPGKSVSDQLYVSNLNKNVPAKVNLNIVDFKSSGETGTPALQLQENAPQTPWSLKPFITLPKTIELAPGESKYVPFSVRIPEGQGAGSYYSAIKYDPQPGEGSDTVVISGAPSQLVFVTVPGKATELMNLKKFGGYDVKEGQENGNFKSLYVSSQPLKLAYLLQNAGNVAESPSGSIQVKNIFGKQVKFIKNANPRENLALIDQTRRFEVCIESETKEVEQDGRKTKVESCKNPKLLPGIYKAQMSLFYGINGSNTQEINATATIWYMPLWFIGVILVFLALLAFAIFKVRQKLIGTKSHKRGKGKR
jgi:hypothetical protein